MTRFNAPFAVIIAAFIATSPAFAEGESPGGPYVYTKSGSPAKLRAPDEPGDYEIRYHLGQTYRVIGKAPIRVAGTEASLQLPPSVAAGSELEIAWTGPNHKNDFISIGETGAADRDYGAYAYTQDGSPVTIRVPDDPGGYVVRYHTGQTERSSRPEPSAAKGSIYGRARIRCRSCRIRRSGSVRSPSFPMKRWS